MSLNEDHEPIQPVPWATVKRCSTDRRVAHFAGPSPFAAADQDLVIRMRDALSALLDAAEERDRLAARVAELEKFVGDQVRATLSEADRTRAEEWARRCRVCGGTGHAYGIAGNLIGDCMSCGGTGKSKKGRSSERKR
ncbi:MAG: hypothetical protein ACHREM_14115 [Polyangiales bacterium]